MATQKIEYQNKVAIDDVGVPEKNKITADNMNEIKEVVNNNADNADETTAAINSRIDTANNAINNIVENTYTKTETNEKLAQKADISDIPTDLSQLSNATTKFVNETQLQEETTARENTDNNLQGQIDAIVASSDVVDIVGTYQELQNYDTSHLGDNDIIKVLLDSTHNNATSYYRWKKHTSTWQYIGSEGPYYTKSESNEKFVEKETGKGLSSNDFTNAYRTKLDGIESGAEVNIIEKIKLNGTELPISNKEINIPVDDTLNNTSANPIQNKKVFEALEVKEDSSNKTDTLNPESTSTQYPNAEVVYNALVEKQNQIDELQEENNKLKADHPEIEEEGTDLSINGTGDFDLALSPKGNITQETREGINLCPPNFVTSSGTTTKGITLTHSNGIITLNGTATEDANFGLHWTLNMEAGSYTWKMFGMPSDCYTNYYNIGNTYGENVGTKTISATTNLGLQITIPSGKTLNNVVIKPMLVSGTYTNQTFPPYEQYGASPSPSYPSPVKVVDGEYEVEVENKNLFDKNNLNTINCFINVDTQKIQQNDNAKVLYISCFSNTTYIISRLAGKRFIVGDTNIIPNNGVTANNIVSDNTASSITTTTSANAKYLAVFYYLSSADTVTEQEILNSIQIEYGSTATSYIAHAEQTQTIDTSPNPLYSQNDLYFKAVNGDSFYDSLTSEQKANLESGSWYVHNEFKKIVLNGTTSPVTYIKLGNVINTGFIVPNDIKVPANNDTAGNLKSNYFISKSTNYLYNNKAIGIGLRTDKVLFLSFGEDANYSTTEAINTWLSTHNTEIIYELATPTNTKITNTTLINQLEALLTLTAYQDQTNISQTHNEAQADMIINAKTIMSLRYMQNEIEELKQAILNS